MCLWVPAKVSDAAEESEKLLKGNAFAILAAESDDIFSDQAWDSEVRMTVISEMRWIKIVRVVRRRRTERRRRCLERVREEEKQCRAGKRRWRARWIAQFSGVGVHVV